MFHRKDKNEKRSSYEPPPSYEPPSTSSPAAPMPALEKPLPSPSLNHDLPTLPSSSFRSKFASLSLHMTDRIRLLNFPPEINDLIRQAIITTWVRGVQAERDYGGSYEFKLKGNPWTGWSDDSIHARRLVRNIFEGLLNNGWVLALSTDISKKTSDKDTLIFRHQDPAPSTCEWTTIAFSRQDRVRLIDAPPRLVEDVVKALGLITKKASSHDRIAGVYDIQLSAYLWWATGEDAVTARRVLLQLMEVLEAHGFTVYASVDQGNGSEDSTETDTWHCCRPVGWQQGAPVYHA